MWMVLLAAALAQDSGSELEPVESARAASPDLETVIPLGGNAPAVHRIRGVGHGSGATLSGAWVIGETGGTGLFSVGGRYREGRYATSVSIPLIIWDGSEGRTVSFGNLQADAFMAVSGSNWLGHIGVEFFTNMGERTYTWLNRPGDAWPGSGVLAVWEMQIDLPVTVLVRTALGVQGARGFDPFPRAFPRAELALGLDRTIVGPLGFYAEAAGAWWDPSPLELSSGLRVDLVEGLRLSTTAVLPLGVWAGLSPAFPESPGVSEFTWWVRLAAAR